MAMFQTGNTMVIVFVDTPQPITTDALADAIRLQISYPEHDRLTVNPSFPVRSNIRSAREE